MRARCLGTRRMQTRCLWVMRARCLGTRRMQTRRLWVMRARCLGTRRMQTRRLCSFHSQRSTKLSDLRNASNFLRVPYPKLVVNYRSTDLLSDINDTSLYWFAFAMNPVMHSADGRIKPWPAMRWDIIHADVGHYSCGRRTFFLRPSDILVDQRLSDILLSVVSLRSCTRLCSVAQTIVFGGALDCVRWRTQLCSVAHSIVFGGALDCVRRRTHLCSVADSTVFSGALDVFCDALDCVR